MTDIIIGARKPRPPKSRRLLLPFIVVALIYVAARWTAGWWTSYPNPDVKLADADVEISSDNDRALDFEGATLATDGLRVVRASGSPAVLGAATGRLLGDDLDAMTARLDRSARRGGGGDLFARFLGRERGDFKLRTIDDGIPGHQLVELAALAKGARASGASTTYTQLVRAQAAFDVGGADPNSEGAANRTLALSLSVVTPLRGASGQRLLLAHSMSLPGIEPTDGQPPVVRLFRPEGVIAFASVGSPADVGTFSGVNAEGLVVIAHPISTLDEASSESAQPTGLLVRDILENARTAEQAVAVLEAATPLGSAIYVVADGSSRSAAVVERTPKRFGLRSEATTRVVVDLLVSPELADEPNSERNRRLRLDAARSTRMQSLLENSPPRSPADLAALLRDRDGEEGSPLPLGHRGQVADPSASHVVIFDPSETTATDDASAVLKARQLLATARAHGTSRAAREAAARALALTPQLPDARALASELGLVTPDSAASKPTTRAPNQTSQ